MELKLYFRMLQRGWWLVLLVALVSLLASLTASYLAIPRYKTTARFIITPGSLLTSEGSPETVIAGLETLDLPSVVATYTEVMGSQRILVDSLSYLGVKNFVPKDYTIDAVVLPESSVLELNVSGTDPQLVADLANAIGYQTILFTRSINRIYELNFLDEAAQPVAPYSPSPLRDAGLSLLLGLAGGAVLAILSEQIRVPLEAYRQRLQMDADTGVYNNRYFTRLLEDEVSKNSSDVLSIGIIELNGMSDFTGTLPAQGVLRVLGSVTDTLRKELRGNDNIGRWNDNSFIVMLPMTSAESASRIFKRIYQSLLVPVDLHQYDVKINLDPHVGGGEYSNGITAQELIEKTIGALDQSKRDELNPVYVWEMRSPFWVQKDDVN
ncbi:MAG: diguanylate cyclase [Anaerolineales bacterium]|nr:diguanylate cyclase [Anaerolineales bacterium]MBK8821388.1 diguanylate cyclase [Anaerolineales bacterium]